MKGLLLATAACGAGLGVLGILFQRVQRQQAAIDRLEQIEGVVVVQERGGPARWQRLAPAPRDRAFDRAVAVEADGGLIDDVNIAYCQQLPGMRRFDAGHLLTGAGFKQLAQLPGLRELNLRSAAVDELSWLSALPQVESLDLSNRRIDAEELRHLASLPRLQRLVLRNMFWADGNLAHLGRPVQLRVLDLSRPASKMKDADLVYLEDFSTLEELDLAGQPVTDVGVASLVKLKSLQVLSLNYSTVGDADLRSLAELPALRSLSLVSSDVTDDGLRSLVQTKTLRELDVSRTDVTESGVAALRTESPALTIRRRDY